MHLSHSLKSLALTSALVTSLTLNQAQAGEPSLDLISSVKLPEGAEISAFDRASKTLFVTSGNGLQQVNLDQPDSPSVSPTLLAEGSDITSTAVGTGISSGIVAIAKVNPTDKTLPGEIDFFEISTGNLIKSVTVGPLPDQISFTPDGSKLLVCNEAQSADPEENDPEILPNPEGSLSIIDLSSGVVNATETKAEFTSFNSQVATLRASGVRLFPTVGSTLSVAQDLEPESVTITADGTTAYISLQENNSVAVVDIASATVTSIIPLGTKDHSAQGNGFDASDRDGGINIQNWPVLGQFMPDIIQTFEVGGEVFIVTANEGDGRDVDEERVEDLTLDPTAFPNAASLLERENLGRLKVDNTQGDTDGDGDFDELYGIGARSFSIFRTDGTLVYDSGDDFEQITAERVPGFFNSEDGLAEEFDSRSDAKGPEPEGLALGKVGNRTFAFIGLERTGGVMIYDITDPENVEFIDYNRNPSDAAPEGLVFLSAAESPDGLPMLLVTNEESNTLSTFRFNPPAQANGNLAGSMLSSLQLPEGAEIGAFDQANGIFYVTSGNGLQVVDYSDPSAPAFSSLINPTESGASSSDITSTAVQPGGTGVVAIAVTNAVGTDPGEVLFYDKDGNFLALKTVGPGPDMIEWTPDGTKLLVCNEGESSGDENEPDADINPNGSISIIDVSSSIVSATVTTVDFVHPSITFNALRAKGVRVNTTAPSAAADLEPESVTITPDSGTAYISLQENNAIARLDLSNPAFTIDDILALGTIDHSVPGFGFDASDRDDKINIRNWPVLGQFMPDIVKNVEIGGVTYLVTANEGDGRDVDESRVRSLDLDPTSFPTADQLQDNDQLGRLRVDTTQGDLGEDGDFDVLYGFGTRSFSIFDTAGNLVFDSGDAFERITADLVPDLFNSDESLPEEFDSRSDAKGPEPEGLVLGQVGSRTYAFIGLERTGGVMVYDITDPMNPSFVEYLLNRNDAAPEGLVFVPAEQSETGNALLIVTNEASNTLTTYEFAPKFTLELFHAADQEASAAATGDAPRFSAVLNALRNEDLGFDGQPDNTITVSSGDAFIPGIFFNSSEATYGSGGIADIQIQNELGFQAIALGNHEFDFGTAVLGALIDGSAAGNILDADFAGAQFPYLSTNLDASTDTNLAPLVVPGASTPQANSISSSTVITVNGEKIGIVGATTPTLASISSPGAVTITPSPFGSNPSNDEIDALAAEIQLEVNQLLASDSAINKVVVLAHMQDLNIERALATRLSQVDIIVGGGSNTRLLDNTDILRDGDTRQGEYPEFYLDADQKPVALVNTDGSYKYLGRLVIDFDAAGNIIPSSYDPMVSGAYATDENGVAALRASDLIDPEIARIASEIESAIISTESNVFGIANVFLNGNRSGADTPTDRDGVRTQETNLGNLTAEANLVIAKTADPTVVAAIKNGGGIRASIGRTLVRAGETVASRLPTEELIASDGSTIKPAGGISQNDIAAALAFNNDLALVTVTRAELAALIEHGIGAVPGVSGRFCQVAGMRFSYDSKLPAGNRVQQLVLTNEQNQPTEIIVDGGELVGNAADLFRITTLEFLSRPRFDDGGNFIGGGDGYPFPNYNTDPGAGEVGSEAARINFVNLASESRTGLANFADNGTEQDALAEYLAANFGNTNPYSEFDTSRELDQRIQNLSFRQDEVLIDINYSLWSQRFTGVDLSDPGSSSSGNSLNNFGLFAFGLNPTINNNGDRLRIEEGQITQRGEESLQAEVIDNGTFYSIRFLRRRAFAELGLSYLVEFSSDLSQWFPGSDAATVVAVDEEVEAVTVNYPFFLPNGRKARFARVVVTQN